MVRHSDYDFHWTTTSTADTHINIENTLQPLGGAAFRTTHSFAFAHCLIQPFSSIGLFISTTSNPLEVADCVLKIFLVQIAFWFLLINRIDLPVTFLYS